MSRPFRQLALAALLLLALGLRLVGLNEHPVDADEAMHLHPRPAQEALTFDLMFNPPLFRVLTAAVAEVERTIPAARLLPAAAGTLSVLLLYLLGARLLGPQPGLLAAFLLAVHPWHIRHSQTIRCFALLTFLVVLFELLGSSRTRLARGSSDLEGSRDASGDVDAPLPEPRRGFPTRDVAEVVVLTLALLTHYLAFPFAAAHAVRTFLTGSRRRAVSAAVATAVVSLGLLPFLIGGTERKLGGGAPYEAGLAFLWSLARASLTPGGLSMAAALLLLVLGARDRSARPLLFAPAVWIGATLSAGLAIPIEVRYCLPALPFLLLLAANGAWRWWNGTAPWSVTAGSASGGTLRPRWARLAGATATVLLVLGVMRPLPAYLAAPRDPGAALALHPDLSHVEVDLRPFLPVLSRSIDAASPIFVAVLGPFHYRLAAEMSGGRYPDEAVLSENEEGSTLTAGNLLLVSADPDSVQLRPSDDARGERHGECLLLREPVFPCAPAPGCVPLRVEEGMELYRCGPESCGSFPCRSDRGEEGGP